MTKVLIVDDDPVQLRLTTAIAEKDGFETISAIGGKEALAYLQQDRSIGAVVLDLVMPDLDGMAVMEEMARLDIKCPVIVQTANSSLETTISAMRHGAVDFFVKPVAPERLIISLRNAIKLDELESCVRIERNLRSGKMRISDIITKSPAMDRVLDLATKAARSTIPVLIEGETGVGKEVVARAIQGSSERAGKPFVTVNCASIPANLIESILFGHVKGAFSGAVANHKGKFEEADGGTLFLDEIGELPAESQVKLLRAIQEGEIEPVGASKSKKVNVRFISATNRRLLNLTKAGMFREDLYYRLNVFPLYIPPLRDRVKDIGPLVTHFIARLGADAGRRVDGLSESAAQLLENYDWPGNVRQLENAIYRALVLTESARLLPHDFPQIIAAAKGREQARRQSADMAVHSPPIHIDQPPPPLQNPAATGDNKPGKDRFISHNGQILSLAQIEKKLIAFALEYHQGRMSRVARDLGIGRSTLYRKLKQYELDLSKQNDAA
ncbi:Response regulatory protein [hydrothermal vent metagenome]|uniref:DNA-binding transcriptional regulator NtrC n=1 Tax=hydrothermal vent metagenome TaxID=652676 RepID=A0A3B0TSZ4_9ZZZZ